MQVSFLGYASGVGAAGAGCGDGPSVIKKSPLMSELVHYGITPVWEGLFRPDETRPESKLVVISELCHQLGLAVLPLAQEKRPFIVLGGDHTSAIGTWSAVAQAKKPTGPLGLIWIDAHMDSHTPSTTQSGNYHGMPLASLLGYGEPNFTHMFYAEPKIHPKHLCLIGVRSFEDGEAKLLRDLNVRIFYMEEVKQRGLTAVLKDAIDIATKDTAGYGISLDVDSIDPTEAPGTGACEADGLSGQELCSALTQLATDSRLAGIEIVEFDPHLDHHHLTEKLIFQLITAITLGRLLT
jgi:arginase